MTVVAACADPVPPDCPLPAGLPVFPGAAGFGTTTPAGRGGRVIEVTSLADSGPGTLRSAVAEAGPRTIVFRVGGTITLQNHLEVLEPFLTVAGQTAPGGGVMLNGAGIAVLTHDVLLQHLRVRPGAIAPIDPEDNDSVTVLGSAGGAYNVVIDHLSMSWSEDETFSTYFGAHDVTLSWSVVSEPLRLSRHQKGAHSAGVLFTNGARCASLHHTLMAHAGFRNPLVQGMGRFDVVENVIYDWGELATEVRALSAVNQVNLVGNEYRPGPSSQTDWRQVNVAVGHPVNELIKAESLYATADKPQVFALANHGPSRPDDSSDEWSIASWSYGTDDLPAQYRSAIPFEVPAVPRVPGGQVVDAVLAGAGATRPQRDAVDDRIISEVLQGGGRIIDHVEEVGGFPVLAPGTAPPDRDHDGMPDAWESSRGLDPDDAADGPADPDGDGYTNLEDYLHSLR
ncbi:MAG TPA: hypothetical protein VND93_29725 [Myxococcales bacterium]|nr:hypothetical protein [Myxococcales bacterium]